MKAVDFFSPLKSNNKKRRNEDTDHNRKGCNTDPSDSFENEVERWGVIHISQSLQRLIDMVQTKSKLQNCCAEEISQITDPSEQLLIRKLWEDGHKLREACRDLTLETIQLLEQSGIQLLETVSDKQMKGILQQCMNNDEREKLRDLHHSIRTVISVYIRNDVHVSFVNVVTNMLASTDDHTTEMTISAPAIEILDQIHNASDLEKKIQLAKLFLNQFGSHLATLRDIEIINKLHTVDRHTKAPNKTATRVTDEKIEGNENHDCNKATNTTTTTTTTDEHNIPMNDMYSRLQPIWQWLMTNYATQYQEEAMLLQSIYKMSSTRLCQIQLLGQRRVGVCTTSYLHANTSKPNTNDTLYRDDNSTYLCAHDSFASFFRITLNKADSGTFMIELMNDVSSKRAVSHGSLHYSQIYSTDIRDAKSTFACVHNKEQSLFRLIPVLGITNGYKIQVVDKHCHVNNNAVVDPWLHVCECDDKDYCNPESTRVCFLDEDITVMSGSIFRLIDI